MQNCKLLEFISIEEGLEENFEDLAFIQPTYIVAVLRSHLGDDHSYVRIMGSNGGLNIKSSVREVSERVNLALGEVEG